jgi:hypothetical protein
MDSIEKSAKTVKLALEELGTSRDEVEVIVPKRSIFGFFILSVVRLSVCCCLTLTRRQEKRLQCDTMKCTEGSDDSIPCYHF